MKINKFLTLSVIVLSLCTFYFLKVEKIYENDAIVLGQSCALSGPAKNLGNNMMKGAKAYFNHTNDNGGIYSRKISLISYDDCYEPLYAIKNTRKLINKDKVFSLFGEVGTPTSLAVTSLSKKEKVPFITPFTGAEFLRAEGETNFINLRASYYMETDAIVEYLVEDKGIREISILYQNDAYGKAGYKGVIKAMKARNLELLSSTRYRRNSLSYFNSFNILKVTNPKAIIIIGAYKQSAGFIKHAKNNGMKSTLFCNISFVGSKALINELGDETDNVIISQVVPLPFDTSHVAVKEYQEIFHHYYPNDSFGFVSLEGFLSAKLAVKALLLAGEKLNRKNFLNAFKKLPLDTLEGFKISMSKNDNQALDNVYLTTYKDEKFVQIKVIE